MCLNSLMRGLSDLSQVVYKTSIDHSVIVLHKNNAHYLKSLFWRHEIEFSPLPPCVSFSVDFTFGEMSLCDTVQFYCVGTSLESLKTKK